jgi:tetratricopeptide (TPR) repeat protein
MQDRPRADRIGSYRILEKLGEGSMGVVFRAEQQQPQRTVALKVMSSSFASSGLRRRFQYEIEVLGRLQHPCIAQVYDAGTFEDERGEQPYFAMELVEGRSLTAHADALALDLPARLELLARVCDGVQHAHRRGVVHRDLKPANILVTPDGQPKVLDFGLARALEAELGVTLSRTDSGAVLGTLPYMSPEQAAGTPDEIDTRADVYALGAIGFELVTGRPPIDLTDCTLIEALRRIREDPAPLAARLRPELRGDVEVILDKALSKERERRYESAAALAEDVRRHLRHETILARPATATYRVSRFARRHALGLSSVVTIGVALITATVVSVRYALETERALAEREQVVAFQDAQLEGFDGEAMGAGIRSDVIEEVRLSALRQGRPASEVAARVAQARELMADANFTNVARASLRRDLFEPTLAAVDAQFDDQPLVRARLQQQLAETLREVGLLELAAAPQRSALALRRAHLGPTDPELIESIYYQGLEDASVEALREAVALSRAALGDANEGTATSLSGLAATLHDAGEHAEAEATYREALAVMERAHGPDAPAAADLHGGLGLLLDELGRDEEAEEAYRECLRLARLAHGDGHPSVWAAETNLAMLLLEASELEAAEPLARSVLAARRRHQGDAHPDTIAAVGNLFAILLPQGRGAEVVGRLRQAFEASEASLPVSHPIALQVRRNLGLALIESGQLEAAVQHDQASAATLASVLGESHPQTLEALTDLGRVCEAAGSLEGMVDAYGRAASGHRAAGSLGSDAGQAALEKLAFALIELGRPGEAVAPTEELLALRLGVLDPDHPHVHHARTNRALAAERLGDVEHAARLYEEVLATPRTQDPALDRPLLDALDGLAAIRWDAGQPAEALELYLEALPIMERVPAVEPMRRFSTLLNVATLQLGRDGWESALEHASRAADLATTLEPGGGHFTGLALTQRAAALRGLARDEEAEPVAAQAVDMLRAALGPEAAPTRRAERILARTRATLGE